MIHETDNAKGTMRQKITELLTASECSARDISQELRMSEKEVYAHLSHIARSAASQKRKFIIVPSRCLDCGYVFADRRRFTKPGRCPRCKGQHVENPRFRIV